MANAESWAKIFSDYNILAHNFDEAPFVLTNSMIKDAVHWTKGTTKTEVRILCKQDSRKDVPPIMKEN